MIRHRCDSDGRTTIISARSCPRLIRRRTFSAADIPQDPIPFTFSPTTFLRQNPEPVDSSTPKKGAAETGMIFIFTTSMNFFLCFS